METVPERLSLRDRVALDVMLRWLGNPEVFWDDGEGPIDPEYYTRMAKHAYEVADAFLSVGASAPRATVNIAGMPPNTSISSDGNGPVTVTYRFDKKDQGAVQRTARRKTK